MRPLEDGVVARIDERQALRGVEAGGAGAGSRETGRHIRRILGGRLAEFQPQPPRRTAGEVVVEAGAVDRGRRGGRDAEEAAVLDDLVQRRADKVLVRRNVALAVLDQHALGRVHRVIERRGDQVEVDALELQVLRVARVVAEIQHGVRRAGRQFAGIGADVAALHPIRGVQVQHGRIRVHVGDRGVPSESVNDSVQRAADQLDGADRRRRRARRGVVAVGVLLIVDRGVGAGQEVH